MAIVGKLCGLVALAILSACSTSAEPETSADTIVVGGRFEDGYPQVGFLAYRWDGDWYRAPSCTVSLIGENAVITAAHCLRPGGEYAVGFGWMGNALMMRVRAAMAHPNYTAGGASQSRHDVAVLALDRSLPAIAPHAQPLGYGQVAAIGSQVRYVGYGRSDPGPINQKETDPSLVENRVVGERKSFAARIDNYVDEGWVYAVSGIDGTNCNGDSGGPLMDEAGTTVYGVDSTAWDCELGGRGMIYAATANNVDFIQSSVAKAADLLRTPTTWFETNTWDMSFAPSSYFVQVIRHGASYPYQASTIASDALWNYNDWTNKVFDLGVGGILWVIGEEAHDGTDWYSPVQFGNVKGWYRTSSIGPGELRCQVHEQCGPEYFCDTSTGQCNPAAL